MFRIFQLNFLLVTSLLAAVIACKSANKSNDNADLLDINTAPNSPALSDFFKRHHYSPENQKIIRSGVETELKRKGRSSVQISKILTDEDLQKEDGGLDVLTREKQPIRRERLDVLTDTDYTELVIRFSDRTFSRIGLDLRSEEQREVLGG